MPAFNITRIHTPNGIFKLTGKTVTDTGSTKLQIDTLDILGTDGWITLDIKARHTQRLIHLIEADCIEHIKEKQ
ncbi:hypothetical protein [uncultured Shewanella sp.]|uniref:hypothetical protein n=1 Tax=uncultured Shewanella sp. TaxID=173975 RepID=UPI0026179BC1|nr:hypothetical protein [uncultured Shewanella sp.]